MNLSASTFPLFFYLICSGVFVVFIGLALYLLDYNTLITDVGLQHRIGFCLVLITLIWSLRAGVSDGLGIHFYLVTALHLVFGWQISILIIFFVQLLMCFTIGESFLALGLNGIVSGIVPIFINYFVWRYIESKKIFNPFVYIFGVAFAGAMLSVIGAVVVISVILLLGKVYLWSQLTSEFLAFIPLFIFPEGVLNGMLIAALIVFKPHWVLLFDENKYFK